MPTAAEAQQYERGTIKRPTGQYRTLEVYFGHEVRLPEEKRMKANTDRPYNHREEVGLFRHSIVGDLLSANLEHG
jgi:hypothetical protein